MGVADDPGVSERRFADAAARVNARSAADPILSLGILKTVTFCEEHFGITIPDDQVLPDHMESVRAIARLVESRRDAG